MSNVYSVSSDRRLIIYSISNYIYLRTAYLEGIDRPIILANDYKCGLSECVFKDNLYYAYQNLKGDICVKNIMNSKAEYELKADLYPDLMNPKIKAEGEDWTLFYVVKNPLSLKYSLKCVTCNGENFEKCDLWEMDNDEYTIFGTEDTTYVCIENELYLIEKFGLLSRLKEETKLKMSYDNELKQEYLNKIASQEALIESIKNQYEELMQTAIKYRDEAIKWRSKFI